MFAAVQTHRSQDLGVMEAPIVDGRRKMVHSYNGMLPSYPRIDVHFPFATKMKAPGNYAKQNESGGKKARIGGFHPVY